jgi:hypothetical protein
MAELVTEPMDDPHNITQMQKLELQWGLVHRVGGGVEEHGLEVQGLDRESGDGRGYRVLPDPHPIHLEDAGLRDVPMQLNRQPWIVLLKDQHNMVVSLAHEAAELLLQILARVLGAGSWEGVEMLE